MSSKVKNADVVASAEFSADRDWRFMSFNRDIRECPEVKAALKVLGLHYAHRRTEENAGHSVYYSATPIKVDTLVKALPMVAIHNNGSVVAPIAPAPAKPMVSGKSGKVHKSKVETVKSVPPVKTVAPDPVAVQNSRTNLNRLGREIKADLPFCSVAELRTMHTAESGGQHRRNVLANLRDALIARKAELVPTSTPVETVKPIASVNPVKDTIKYAPPVESEPTTKPTNTAVFAAMGAALRAMADVLESLQ